MQFVFDMLSESLFVLNQWDSCSKSLFILLQSNETSLPAVYMVVSAANMIHLLVIDVCRSLV